MDRVYRFGDIKGFQVPNIVIAVEPSCQHPGEWFEAHPDQKPSVSLPKQSVTLEQTRATLKKCIMGQNKLDVDLVLLYLRKLAETMKSPPLDAKWESFGRLIGNVNEVIGPLNLVNVVDRGTEVPMLAGSADETDDEWMLILLAALYCLGAVSSEGYRKSLYRPIGDKLRAAGLSNARILENCYNANGLIWRDLKKMVAVLDMYFVRFPEHPFADARIGTSESRYKDCTALKSLLDFSEQIGMSITEIAEWIWFPIGESEYKSLNKPNQEIDNPYSYTPYSLNLELVTRSIYSSAKNNNMHLFIHIVGSTLGFQRSKNAKPIKMNNITMNILPNAIIFAHALLEQQSGRGETNQSKPNPRDWYPLFPLDYSPTVASKRKEVFTKICNIWTNMAQTRPDTIGHYLRTKASQEVPGFH